MTHFPFNTSQYKAMVFFDLETTGFDYKNGQITQFGAHRILADNSSSAVNWFAQLREGVVYEPKAKEVSSLSEEFLYENGIDEELLAKNVFDFISFTKPVVLIAHNAQFDMLFLLELLKRYGHTIPVEYSVIDTLTIARDRKKYPHTLSEMMTHYNHSSEAALHRADADVGVLVDVFYSMLDEKDDIESYLDIIGTPPKYEVQGYPLPNIRYQMQQWFRSGKKHRTIYERIN
jgi:DNA polymerase-3 subunit epsilon